MKIVICHYCKKPAELVNGMVIYPHRPDLAQKKFYLCMQDDAYVGCHDGTENPLGRLANSELRRLKSLAHVAFDPIWKDGQKSRSEAYRWLSEKLGIQKRDCHIGMFDEETCKRVLNICYDYQKLEI